MSQAYAIEKPKDMRKWCQRPGKKDKDGKNIYTTEQNHKDACDINKIIDTYDKKGVIKHIQKFEGRFGDVSGPDFHEMMNTVVKAQQSFDELPAEIRARFGNDAGQLLSFMDDPANRDEAIKLGIIRAEWTEGTDGLGEHVKDGVNVDTQEPQVTQEE